MSENEIDDTIPNEAHVIINPGKNFDGWWNIDQLIEQVFLHYIINRLVFIINN